MQAKGTRRAPSLVFLCVLDGIALSFELTQLLGYYWLSGKLIGSLHIHASRTYVAASASAAAVTRYQAPLRSPHNALHSPSNV